MDSEDLICFAPSGLYFISGFTRDSDLLQKNFFIKKMTCVKNQLFLFHF